MDYVAEASDFGIGIQVSDDEQQCWVIWKPHSSWEKLGDAYQISQIPEIDVQVRTDSGLTLACRILGQQNPQARRDLNKVVYRNTKMS